MDILGTIIASTLNYDQLCTQLKERPAFDAGKSKYAPCDGRSIVGSDYSDVTKQKEAVDLRGRFLRGLNIIYEIGQKLPFNPIGDGDPDVARQMGSYQSDAFKNHVHVYTGKFLEAQGGSGFWGRGFESNSKTSDADFPIGRSNPEGKEETRPRNVAVYYYMKINC